jgi:hypothetical protein
MHDISETYISGFGCLEGLQGVPEQEEPDAFHPWGAPAGDKMIRVLGLWLRLRV